jgi:hypothetical protein
VGLIEIDTGVHPYRVVTVLYGGPRGGAMSDATSFDRVVEFLPVVAVERAYGASPLPVSLPRVQWLGRPPLSDASKRRKDTR